MNDKFCEQLSGIDAKGRLVKTPCQEHDCLRYIKVRGSHPQTGEPVDQWKCAYEWMPILIIDGNQQSARANEAIESFRNQMVEANAALLGKK